VCTATEVISMTFSGVACDVIFSVTHWWIHTHMWLHASMTGVTVLTNRYLHAVT